VRVEAQTSKVRQARVVYPKPEAMALLKSVLDDGRLPITSQARKRVIKRMRNHLGLKVWPKDVTRHSAASYWLAESGSAEIVAEALGHSVKTLKRHYLALVTREQAAQFWKLAVKLAKVPIMCKL
jgi:integrase